MLRAVYICLYVAQALLFPLLWVPIAHLLDIDKQKYVMGDTASIYFSPYWSVNNGREAFIFAIFLTVFLFVLYIAKMASCGKDVTKACFGFLLVVATLEIIVVLAIILTLAFGRLRVKGTYGNGWDKFDCLGPEYTFLVGKRFYRSSNRAGNGTYQGDREMNWYNTAETCPLESDMIYNSEFEAARAKYADVLHAHESKESNRKLFFWSYMVAGMYILMFNIYAISYYCGWAQAIGARGGCRLRERVSHARTSTSAQLELSAPPNQA